MNTNHLHNYLYFFFSVVVFLIGIVAPSNNFDLVFYTGSSFSLLHSDIDKVHSKTYGLLEKELPKSRFESLTSGRYGEPNYKNSKVFAEQLSFYKSRIAYYSIPTLLSFFGVSIIDSFYITSSLFSLISLLLLFLLSRRFIPSKYISFLPILFGGIGFVGVSRLSTPDSLACFGVILAFYTLLEYRRLHLLLLPILILLRRDLIILSVILLALHYLKHKKVEYSFIFSLVFCIVIYYLSTYLSGHPGWSTVFSHTFNDRILYPSSNPGQVSLKNYISTSITRTKGLVNNTSFTLFLFSSFTSVSFLYYKSDDYMSILLKPSFASEVFISSIFYVILHFALFPAMWSRFFVSFYSITFVLFIALFIEDSINIIK